MVDTPVQSNLYRTSQEDYLNFANDNKEGFLVVRSNQADKIKGKFQVQNSPATFLISAEGIIKKDWRNLALPAQLAFAIEDELIK